MTAELPRPGQTALSWVPPIIWAGMIFVLSSIPHLKTDLGFWDLVLRKIAHMIEYAVLCVLLLRALRSTWPAKPRQWLRVASLVLAVLYAVSDEFHQSFVPGRGPSAVDVLIDTLGALMGLSVLSPCQQVLRRLANG